MAFRVSSTWVTTTAQRVGPCGFGVRCEGRLQPGDTIYAFTFEQLDDEDRPIPDEWGRPTFNNGPWICSACFAEGRAEHEALVQDAIREAAAAEEFGDV